ncbi:MAB_1171c family putative transporter [Streptomyces sp. NPDC059215]|uniref:MAB_1171c family putative transporter n=1 Tax=Streptomyces sp. NPDC059215 TaxID=3346772 RepID=UPI0036A2603B
MSGLINYISCGALWLGLGAKLPDLVRHRDPFLRALSAALALGSLCFLLGAPPTVGVINRLSGIPNLAAPLTYAVITTYSASSMVLIVYWRGGPAVRRTARCWMTGYAVVVVALAVLFALGDAPRERRTDFDTYYSTTPYTAEMIVLYLVAHLIAVVATATATLRWARDVHGWLRAGLLTMAVGTVLGTGYSIAKLVAVAGHWCGQTWSPLVTQVAPAAAGLGALLFVTGTLIPLAGPRLTTWLLTWRAYVRLRPLEDELDEMLTRRHLRVPRPSLLSPTTLLVWRQTSIQNALGHLDAYALFDHNLYEQTHTAALLNAPDAETARAAAWAATISAAVRVERSGRRVSTPAGSDGRMLPRSPEPAALVHISDVLAASGSAQAARPRRAAHDVGYQ